MNLEIVYAKTGQAKGGLGPGRAGAGAHKQARGVSDAEPLEAARRAVQLDLKLIDANYMLGIALMKQGKITSETAAHLAMAMKKASAGARISCWAYVAFGASLRQQLGA